MNNFSQLFPENLYHSYIIEGNPENIVYILRDYLENRGEINKNSVDLLLNLYDSFTVSDSKEIKEWHNNKPTEGNKKICIIGTKFINKDAEQTLLKIIEEPNPYTHFFIVVPDSSLLLSTILSRVQLIDNLKIGNGIDDNEAEDFFKANLSIRIEKVAQIIKKFKDNENSGGLRHEAIMLINGIEKIVYLKWKKDLDNKDLKFILEELKKSREYLSIPGASVKMILEHIALMI